MYEIRLPAAVRALLQSLALVVSFGLEGVPLACVGAAGYVQRLVLWMLVPLMAVGVTSIAVAGHLVATGRFSALRAMKRIIPIMLKVRPAVG